MVGRQSSPMCPSTSAASLPPPPRRQLLFTPDQVGMNKVDACKQSLERSHAFRTSAAALHCNAVTRWADIVAEAQEQHMTAIFNG